MAIDGTVPGEWPQRANTRLWITSAVKLPGVGFPHTQVISLRPLPDYCSMGATTNTKGMNMSPMTTHTPASNEQYFSFPVRNGQVHLEAVASPELARLVSHVLGILADRKTPDEVA